MISHTHTRPRKVLTDALLIAPNSSNGENSVRFAEPASVELVIRHNEPEDKAEASGKESKDKKDNFPWFNGQPVLPCSYRDPVCDKTADDLTDTVEAEPDA